MSRATREVSREVSIVEPAACGGDPFPSDCAVLEVRIGEVRQIFDALDPAPFRERDLDPKADEYITDWARDVPAGQPLGLVIYLTRDPASPENLSILRDALHEHFLRRAQATRRQLHRLLALGRQSLLIGLAVLAVAMIAGELLAGLAGRYDYGEILGHSLLIGGWVALWRPFEILLYDWWPVRAEARLFDRLSTMAVRLERAADRGTEAAVGDPNI